MGHSVKLNSENGHFKNISPRRSRRSPDNVEFRYPGIFESATFSFRFQKFPRPHVAYLNRSSFACSQAWYLDSLKRNEAYTLCRHIGLLSSKKLDTIWFVRTGVDRRIRFEYRFTVHTLSDSLRMFFSSLESGFKNIRIRMDWALVIARCCFARNGKEVLTCP